MRIVFGHNHFRLKKVQPSEIGLYDRSYDNITFDLWQKYGHLYWIPLFPMGKFWTINKGDGKKYVCPAELEHQLDANPGRSSKKSIFAWSGFLAVFIGMLVFAGVDKMKEIQRKNEYAQQYREVAKSLTGDIDNIVADDYLLFNAKRSDQTAFGYNRVPFRVLRTENNRVLLGAYFSPDTDSSASEIDEIVKVVQQTPVQDSFWVERSLLKEAVSKENDDKSFKGIALPGLYAGNTFQLKEIKYITGAEPEANREQESQSDNYYELVNRGFDVRADSIVPASSGLTCKLSKKRAFLNDSIIALQLNGKGTFLLYCSDKQKLTYVYEVDNTGYQVEVTKVED